jgi:acetylornithine deacetylase/succinyl-diaminopimelate desuccinylase-like protein
MTIRDLLKTLVALPSVYPNEAPVFTFIKDYLTKAGFSIETVVTEGGRNNIVATYGNAESYLGFYGHMDTVPPEEDYGHDPFKMRIENGTIARGLGVCDMKGGLSAIVKAGEYAVGKGIPVKLIFGVDEEDISRGAHDLVDSGLMKTVDYLIVAESGQVKDPTKDMSVCLGRKGRLVFDVVVKGRTAHAAEAEKGVNAIGQAARLVTAMNDLSFPAHGNLGDTKIVVQHIEATTGAMSVPDRCVVRFSALTNPLTKGSDIETTIRALGTKEGIELTISPTSRITPYGESYETPLDHPFTKVIFDRVLSAYDVDPMYTASVADENVFANRLGIPVLTIGPIGGGDHTRDEWVDVNSLDTVVEAFMRILDTRA